MPNSYGSCPAFDLLFDTGGHPVDSTATPALIEWLNSPAGGGITDVIFISHGWNNDIDEARQLYQNFFTAMDTVRSSQPVAGNRHFAVAAIFWPSKRFADADLIPGGTAAALAPTVVAQLNAQLDLLKSALAQDSATSAKIEHARAQIPELDSSQSAQDAFVQALLSAIPPGSGEKDEGLDDSIAEIRSGSIAGHVTLARLSAPLLPVIPVPGSHGVEGHALALGGLVSGITSAAERLANLLTYYTMKDRAGIVGRGGVVDAIKAVQAAVPRVKLHLIGHSFGGRLVTAAANSLSTAGSVASLLLLEAAYSHNGLAKNWDGVGDDGSFRGVLTNGIVAGPVLITHSSHDIPVGLAYPIASRLMNQVASAVIGGPTDKFGGMGRNGAQNTPEAFDDTLRPVGTPYVAAAAGKKIRNLNGDGPPPLPTITGHSDVSKPEIAWAWLSSL